jgi:hypothetical protein
MAGKFATVDVEVKTGPTFRLCVDVLSIAADVLRLVPECHQKERAELRQRMQDVAESVQRNTVAHNHMHGEGC